MHPVLELLLSNIHFAAPITNYLRDWKPLPIHILLLQLLNLLAPHSYSSLQNKPAAASDAPSRVLYVANHCLTGLDAPLVVAGIHQQTGNWPRALAHAALLRFPTKHVMNRLGVVNASPSVCAALMDLGQPILVFPGGAREALRKKSEDAYSLHWRDGFARMAIQHNYTIVPVASTGLPEMLSILADMPSGLLLRYMHFHRQQTRYLGEKRADSIPIVVPVALRRLFVRLGEPIRADAFNGSVSALRDKTRTALLDLIQNTKSFREDFQD